MGARLKDVAKKAGVSPATVSYVFTGNRPISKKVSERVLAVAKQLDYRPDRYAQAMRTGRTQTIGLMLPNIINGFYPELAQTIQGHAHDNGYAVVLVDAQGDAAVEQQGFAKLTELRVDGILWCPVCDIPRPPIPDFDGPIVCFDGVGNEKFDQVRSDHQAEGQAVAELIVRLGHRRVGLLSGPASITSAVLRRDALLQGSHSHYDVVWHETVSLNGDLPPRALDRLREDTVSLIVAPSDLAAIRVMRYLREIQIAVPGDVSIVGYDDMPYAALMAPSLTTIRQPVGAVGLEAVSLLLEEIEKPDKDRAPKKLLLGVRLVERESTRPYTSD